MDIAKLGAVLCQKRGAVVSQLVAKLKESVPPPPPESFRPIMVVCIRYFKIAIFSCDNCKMICHSNHAIVMNSLHDFAICNIVLEIENKRVMY